jgi:hypothetical protein
MSSRDDGAPRWCRRGFWIGVILLVALQQYAGFWDSRTLVLGFLPAPLCYQVVVSLLAVVVWWIGTAVAWPADSLDAEVVSHEDVS